MSELLAPAGNMEAFVAAVANGADAVYLGMQKYGARAYSCNFDEATLEEAVAYAHLRDVKVYVTMNTIVFENELDDIKAQLHFLNDIGVDGVIAQDLAVLTYVASHFQDMEAHCSTQMGIDDLDGTLMAKELGAKRVVISREVSLKEVKAIRKQADMPLEVFVHGALCVSYSGNCIMSSMTGNRSGNRGRCIGSCRKLYDVIDTSCSQTLGQNYILSTKDLNTINQIGQLQGIDSLKIEGRMKEPAYVANVVSRYRKALDGNLEPGEEQLLAHTFNRTFTLGYLFDEDRKDITNVERPNNHGFEIGVISSAKKGTYGIELTQPLRQNDVIRIRHQNEDVNLSVAKLYDDNGMLINGSSSKCFIRVKERLSVGDTVYKTKDVAFHKQLEAQLTGEYRRFPLDFTVHAYPGAPLVVEGHAFGLSHTYVGEDPLDFALKNPTTQPEVEKQLGRLNDTVFSRREVEYDQANAFIPAKLLNSARKEIVASLYQQKLASKPRRVVAAPPHDPVVFAPQPAFLTASCTTEEQYLACQESGISAVYYHNVVKRNNMRYHDIPGTLLIGGLGGIHHYRHSNHFVTDYSLNVVNAQTCYHLHRLGAQRVTLSYEINERQLTDLLASYQQEFKGMPSLEMIIYGRAPLLVTKYCPLKKMDQCKLCRTHTYEIRDDFGSFPLLSHEDCTCTVLNGKTLNLLDEMSNIPGIQAFRLNFTTESGEDVARIIKIAQGKLDGTYLESIFNPKTDTRGHYHKDIM